MSLILIWCLAGAACKTHEIPLPPVPISDMECAVWATLKTVEMQASYPDYELKAYGCVKGVRA